MTKAGWADLFRDGRSTHTIILTTGVSVHAITVYMISTVMPTVVADIGGIAYYAWSTMLYMLGSIIGSALGGLVTATIGGRRGYTIAALTFLVGTAVCALAPNMAVLLIGRTLAGFGGGLIVALSWGFVRVLYPAELRTRILATLTSMWGAAALLGPLFGGVAAEVGWWRGAFWSIMPLVFLFLSLAWRALPSSTGSESEMRLPLGRITMLGGGVICVGLVGNVDDLALRIALLVAAVALVVRTFLIDETLGNDLFPTRALSIRSAVGTGNLINFLAQITVAVYSVYLTLLLQVVYEVSPLMAGYINSVVSFSWTLGSAGAAGLRGRWEQGAVIGGPMITGAGLLGLTLWASHGSIGAIIVFLFVLGLGIGVSNVHINARVMSYAAPGEEIITATSMPTIRNLGIAFGSAATGIIANAAGLAQGISPETVSTAITWLYAIGCLAPATAVLLAIRLVWFGRKFAATAEA